MYGLLNVIMVSLILVIGVLFAFLSDHLLKLILGETKIYKEYDYLFFTFVSIISVFVVFYIGNLTISDFEYDETVKIENKHFVNVDKVYLPPKENELLIKSDDGKLFYLPYDNLETLDNYENAVLNPENYVVKKKRYVSRFLFFKISEQVLVLSLK